MTTKSFCLAGACAGVVMSSAIADLDGVFARNVGDLGAGADSWRVYLEFDNPLDQLLAVSGTADVMPLYFASVAPLVQNCVLPDSILCDAPKGLDLGGDSWVTIGAGAANGADTAFSPNFLDGDGVESVIKGNFFSQPDNGGYFDQNPGTPVLPDEDDSVLIAQFTIAGEPRFEFAGTANYIPGGADGFVSEAFVLRIVPTPGALALFGLAGLGYRRRRR